MFTLYQFEHGRPIGRQFQTTRPRISALLRRRKEEGGGKDLKGKEFKSNGRTKFQLG